MLIRKADENDIKEINEIYDRVLEREERGEISTGWIRGVYPTEKTVREAFDAGELFAAFDNGRAVASARINRVQVPEYANAAWTSGKGIGSGFVKFYEDYAAENNCPYLRMDTNERNTAARRLYNKLGYREADIVPCDFNGIRGVRLVCLEKSFN